MATTSTSGARSMRALSDCRPIRPKPLMPTRVAMVRDLLECLRMTEGSRASDDELVGRGDRSWVP